MPVGETAASPINVASGNNILQNFSDATAGRSQQLFYAMGTTDSAGVDYVLGRDAGFSEPNTISSASTFDIDFDITINKPTIFAGIATVDATWGKTGAGAGATTMEVQFDIIHYDGSTETVIGTVITATYSGAADVTKNDKLKVTITKQLFGVGHTLRLRAYGTGGLDANDKVDLHFDPNTAGNELKLWMPIVNLE